MNKRASFNIFTFVIIVMIIAFIILLGIYFITQSKKTVDDTEFFRMISKIENNVDLMMYENYGVTKEVDVFVPDKVTQICVLDYSSYIVVSPNQRVQFIAEELNISFATENMKSQNLFVLTKNAFKLYYIEGLAVEESNDGVYCMNITNSNLKLRFKSLGGNVLVTKSS